MARPEKLAKKLAAEAEALEASNGESDAGAVLRARFFGEGEREGEGRGPAPGLAARTMTPPSAEPRRWWRCSRWRRAIECSSWTSPPARACPDAIAPTLGAVLADRSVLKTGFGLAEDLRRLANPPAFGAERLGGPFGGVGPVIDLQHVWAAGTRIAESCRRGPGEEGTTGTRGGGGGGGGGGERGRRRSVAASPPKRLVGPWSLKEHYQRKHLVGLSHLTAAVLGKPLDKATRMNDWSKRPLTPQQVTRRWTRGCWWN